MVHLGQLRIKIATSQILFILVSKNIGSPIKIYIFFPATTSMGMNWCFTILLHLLLVPHGDLRTVHLAGGGQGEAEHQAGDDDL